MKSKYVIGTTMVLLAVTALAWPAVRRQQMEARRRFAHASFHQLTMGDPQEGRALRFPSKQKIEASLTVTAHRVLKQSTQLTLFSLEPIPLAKKGIAAFHGHEILGQIVTREPKDKAALLASFYDGLAPADGRFISAQCFEPRHCLRAVSEGKTVDLLICFHCGQFNVYIDNKEVRNYKEITRTPEPFFNRVLTAANRPVSD